MIEKDFIRELFSFTVNAVRSNNYNDNIDFKVLRSLSPAKKIGDMLKDYLSDYLILKKRLFKPETDKILGLLNEFSWLYGRLDDKESRDLLIRLIAFRMLGHRFVRLNDCYNTGLLKFENEVIYDRREKIKIRFRNWTLNKFYLSNIGYDITLFFTLNGIYEIFVLEQYKYKTEAVTVEVKPGDYVIDAGGCWGDSALYFAHKAGPTGKVFSFEFLPENIEIFNRNIMLNPGLKRNISIFTEALYKEGNVKMNYDEKGPGTRLSYVGKKSKGINEITTTTIDGFVGRNNIEKVDFIKMDIEGAEPEALYGSMNTIKKFKPRLAVSVYHNIEDLFRIPQFLDNLNMGYKFYLGHKSIDYEETVLFAE